jgi:hypothetical protein
MEFVSGPELYITGIKPNKFLPDTPKVASYPDISFMVSLKLFKQKMELLQANWLPNKQVLKYNLFLASVF